MLLAALAGADRVRSRRRRRTSAFRAICGPPYLVQLQNSVTNPCTKTYIKLQKFLKLSSRRCAEVVSSKIADFRRRIKAEVGGCAKPVARLKRTGSWRTDQSHLSSILRYDMGITPVCDYIEAHLDDRLTLAELAGVACLSPYHFSRSFKQTVGLGTQRYVVQRRLERAKTLMRRSNQPLAMIAQEAGFTDHSHLTAIFRRETGSTPGRYRAALT
jgi:AraC-like DNA-binding protein